MTMIHLANDALATAGDLTTFFTSSKNLALKVIAAFFGFLGACAIGVAGFKAFQKVAGGDGARQVSWLSNVLLPVVIAGILFGGTAWLVNIATGSKTTLDTINGASMQVSALLPALGL